MEQISRNIKKLRQQKSWSQTELAKKVGTTQQTIALYESNSQIPSIERIIKLAYVFGVSTDELLGVKPIKPQPQVKSHHKNTRIAQMQNLFEKLPPTEQRSILKFIRGIIKKDS